MPEEGCIELIGILFASALNLAGMITPVEAKIASTVSADLVNYDLDFC